MCNTCKLKKKLHYKKQLMGKITSLNTEEIIPQIFREVSFMFSFEKATVRLKVKKNIAFLISHLISLEILLLLFSILIP